MNPRPELTELNSESAGDYAGGLRREPTENLPRTCREADSQISRAAWRPRIVAHLGALKDERKEGPQPKLSENQVRTSVLTVHTLPNHCKDWHWLLPLRLIPVGD